MRRRHGIHSGLLALALATFWAAVAAAGVEGPGVVVVGWEDRPLHSGLGPPGSLSDRSCAPAPRQAGMVLGHRRTSRSQARRSQSYLSLKGGGLRVGESPSTDGVFLGFEVGGVLEQLLEVGFSMDYFYRSSETVHVLSEGSFGNLPIQIVESDRTAAHLVPLGLTMRLRLPVGNMVTPFASTTLAYEMLYLENTSKHYADDPLLDVLLYEETFTGFGVQAAGGIGLQLSPSVGVFGEAGYHWGSPSQHFLVQGRPVDLEVNMDGPFLRGGIRLGL